MKAELGKVISRKRLEMGVSQRELAKAVNVSNSTIARIERGDPIVPDNKTLRAIAEMLGLDYNYLLALNNQIDDDPDIRTIQRAVHHMTNEERDRMLQLLRLSFPKAFHLADTDGSEIPKAD